MNKKAGEYHNRIDWVSTLVPFMLIVLLCILFFIFPEHSNVVLNNIRSYLGDSFGSYYLMIGLGTAIVSVYIACSRYGNIVLGEQDEKPKYSFFVWGSMMFTCGLAADILFYSLCEWLLYWEDPHTAEMGNLMDWSSTFTLFHWGPIPWGFYLVLAVAFGFMLHVRKRKRQKYSEACRPILGKYTDRLPGRLIDLLAVFALLAGTATTFSVATPLLSQAIKSLTGFDLSERAITIFILVTTCLIYTYSVMKGMIGVSILANICTYLFYGLLMYVLLFGGQCRFIIECGFSAVGRLAQNFIVLSTYSDPARTTGFAQNWTIFYWAYWMVWCVAAPFFIGSISRGRTVRQTILGGYVFGLGSTFVSFIVLGNYGLGLQISGKLDIVSLYEKSGDLYTTIIEIVRQLPCSTLVMIALIIAMIAFYATSFDSITLVAAQYSYKDIKESEEPGSMMKAFWSILLIMLPIALVFSESSMANIQSVSIIAAFPIGLVIVLITASFIKDAGIFLEGKEEIPGITSEDKGDEDDEMSDEKIEEIIDNWEYMYGDK
ncbi:BCCT family transporter [Oribacterium sp. WCC10]|uniref:BCCT family transporter n=1 Tax=Oribacterium sp. WCC10 TaxID=1855343 RepID=UPI0008E46CA5|nr:BCCT family transporter [Oribacterium sp. WCC10]SFG34454.1 betaine/carnitine transporter, BCCT family [Oribacterium sp. WCC10]